MEEESIEVHSEDNKTLLDKNKKRIVKTPAQVEALEKFYDEHKYPTEPMKIQLAEFIGLTEKQVSGWFCHRRLKDKRLLNGETFAVERQDRSSGVIQDRGSGLRQDSCGSTKQGEDRNFDTREVESGRLTLQKIPRADFIRECSGQYTGNIIQVDDSTSESSSSLPDMPFQHNGKTLDLATSRYRIPKFPVELKGVKPRSGPSGYLKVKGQVENSAITAVEMKLGRHYREDGPPLGVEFDPLPPCAFESPMQNPVNEPFYSGEPIPPASPDVSKICQRPMFDKDFGRNSGITSYKSIMDRAKTVNVSHTPDSCFHQKFGQHTSLPSTSAYYSRRTFSVELPENSSKYAPGDDDGDDYQMRSRQGVEVMRKGSFLNHRHILPYGAQVEGEPAETGTHRSNGVKVKGERHIPPYGVKVEGEPVETWTHRSNGVNVEGEPVETWTRKSNDHIANVPLGDAKKEPSYIAFMGDAKKEPSYIAIKGNDYHNIADKGASRYIIKDAKFYGEQKIINEIYEPDQGKIHFKNEMPAPKRVRGEFLHRQYQQRSFPVDNQPWTSHVMRSRASMPSSFCEDEGSTETSSSVE